MDLLKRKLAPILPAAWKLIDDEATRVLKLLLAGRKLVDFKGPHGWELASVNTGHLDFIEEKPAPEVSMGVRKVQPLVELRVPMKLRIMELDQVARGANDPDLSPVVRAAESIALAEDRAIFQGIGHAGIAGLVAASPHPPLQVPSDLSALPRQILAAKDALRAAGVAGPYALVLGSVLYDQVFAATEDGHLLVRQVERLVDRPIVRADAIRGGLVMSLRGGDYELTVGQDLSIGYAHHTRDEVELYITESFAFRVLEPTAAVALASPS